MFEHLQTEQINEETEHLDSSSSLEIVTLMNHADKSVPIAVEKVLPKVALAIDQIVVRLKQGGRLIYAGAGTSGRLGILDAAECPPTFSTPPDLVQSIIAGGKEATFRAIENAEDDEPAGAKALSALELSTLDAVVGLSASGRTPFVKGALQHAATHGALTISVSCNPASEIGKLAQIAIDVQTGPEVLAGSTRLKAGTAQKMILNMISTGAMVGLGKVYKNLMVDMKATNFKLQERSKSIIMRATGTTYETAESTLAAADQHVKLAILMIEKGVSADVGKRLLDAAEGHLGNALSIEEGSR
ncbi:N-acetylmuramic acid 6-phosphate etherase [Alicyclobacillus fastidiosus]|uniref:N-acetylmuramic acid 6-phosphate etherase n=1 Tax=Alicyclobacillus fastidiosus TaxID=392011 RepID=A0ABV5AB50_9BACL|nr:N-acetylmuramic acid 6-phosphate etherase [Alicyclobacillus fastidiosus]WEH10536.1 N-acetylmuramic acid 6-phosphate etherase [Alicyclobacillus fastidiosus]